MSTFASTLTPHIRKIERVENPILFLRFLEEKKKLENLQKSKFGSKRIVLEKELFLGISTDSSCRRTISRGFNHGSVSGSFYACVQFIMYLAFRKPQWCLLHYKIGIIIK